jgi:hypothetical protein
MSMAERLIDWQEASERVEKRMFDAIVQFIPAQEMKIGDAQWIARSARAIAFDEFTKAQDKP